MRRELCWIGLLVALWVFVLLAPTILGWPILDGFSGLVIQFFLGYCAIILVAQVFSALKTLRTVVVEVGRRRKVSRRVLSL